MRAISPWPGRKASTEPGSARSACSTASATASSTRWSGSRGDPAGLDREGAPLGLDDGGAVEQARHAGAVERRRHDEDAKVGPERALDVERQGEAEVGVERPLVIFVEDDGGDAGEFGVVQHRAGEHALGDDLDPGAGRNGGVEARLEADGAAERVSQRFRHAFGGGTGGEAAGLEKQDAAAPRPGFVEEGQGHAGRLAGARRRHQHSGRPLPKRRQQLRQGVVDGQADHAAEARDRRSRTLKRVRVGSQRGGHHAASWRPPSPHGG